MIREELSYPLLDLLCFLIILYTLFKELFCSDPLHDPETVIPMGKLMTGLKPFIILIIRLNLLIKL